jgi:hypothetical protein
MANRTKPGFQTVRLGIEQKTVEVLHSIGMEVHVQR